MIMKTCSSNGCRGLAFAKWQAVVDAPLDIRSQVEVRFDLCRPCDTWYQSAGPKPGSPCARIGELLPASPDRPYSWRYRDEDQFCGAGCNRRTGHCTGCGDYDRVQVNGLCVECLTKSERAHSWCPKAATG